MPAAGTIPAPPSARLTGRRRAPRTRQSIVCWAPRTRCAIRLARCVCAFSTRGSTAGSQSRSRSGRSRASASKRRSTPSTWTYVIAFLRRGEGSVIGFNELWLCLDWHSPYDLIRGPVHLRIWRSMAHTRLEIMMIRHPRCRARSATMTDVMRTTAAAALESAMLVASLLRRALPSSRMSVMTEVHDTGRSRRQTRGYQPSDEMVLAQPPANDMAQPT
jgi:hypothetical protein